MAQKSLGILAQKEIEILLGGLLIVLFWAAAWGLIEEGVDYLKDEFKLKRVNIYIGLFIFVLLIIYLFPTVLDRV